MTMAVSASRPRGPAPTEQPQGDSGRGQAEREGHEHRGHRRQAHREGKRRGDPTTTRVALDARHGDDEQVRRRDEHADVDREADRVHEARARVRHLLDGHHADGQGHRPGRR